jgi:hypothetical protein
MASRVKIIVPSAAERAEIQSKHDAIAAHQYAKSARYDRSAKAVRFVLRSGAEVSIPIATVSYFRDVSPAQLAKIELYPTGEAISIPELDIDVSVPGLLRDALGFELQQRRAGRVKSAARAKASRANGKKGGRPRKAQDA